MMMLLASETPQLVCRISVPEDATATQKIERLRYVATLIQMVIEDLSDGVLQ